MKLLQHDLERCARVRADKARRCERRQRTNSFFDAEPCLCCHQAGLLERVTKIADAALGFTCTGRKQIRYVPQVATLKLELREGGSRQFGGVTDTKLTSRCKGQGTVQAAVQDVRCFHTGLSKLRDAVGRLRAGIFGVGTRLDRGLTEQVHVRGRLVCRGLHAGHCRIKICESLHR